MLFDATDGDDGSGASDGAGHFPSSGSNRRRRRKLLMFVSVSVLLSQCMADRPRRSSTVSRRLRRLGIVSRAMLLHSEVVCSMPMWLRCLSASLEYFFCLLPYWKFACA